MKSNRDQRALVDFNQRRGMMIIKDFLVALLKRQYAKRKSEK